MIQMQWKMSEHYEFEKWSASSQIALSYQCPFIGTTATNISSTIQTINNVTQASEHAILGGWYSVKGFNSTPQYGEHYMVINSEQMIPISQYNLPDQIKNLNIQLKWFGDAGIIYRKHNLSLSNSNSGHAYAIGNGIGIGMKLFSGQFDFKIAHGIKADIPIPGIETFWSWGAQF